MQPRCPLSLETELTVGGLLDVTVASGFTRKQVKYLPLTVLEVPGAKMCPEF